MIDFFSVLGFDWDASNRDKNWEKHHVSNSEIEEYFFNLPLLLQPDEVHSTAEARYYVLGQTNAGRRMFIVFTIRNEKIRVISARDMSKREGESMSKPIPEIRSENEEREFWAEQDSSEILDWKQAQRAIFPNLKPTLKSISLRLPESMLDELRQLANERDIPYQSLVKHFLRERIDQEYKVNKR